MNNINEKEIQKHIDKSSNFYKKGDYLNSESSIKSALEISKKYKNQKYIALSLSNLGTILMAKGDYSEALNTFLKALQIKQELGEQQSSITTTLNQIAQIYSATGDYRKAEKMYEQALSINERIGDQYSLAITLSNLASVYSYQGRLNESEALYKKTLEIQKEIKDLSNLSKTNNNLGHLYLSMHDLDKAQEAFQKSLQYMETNLGELHPDTASVKNSLAIVLAKQGNDKAAEEMYDSSLRSLISSLGAKHPYIENLAIEKETNVKFYLLNTNKRHSIKSHKEMLNKGMAAAYYDPWKFNINRIKKGDIVFLYETGVGIVAYGKGTGDVLIADVNGDKGECHYQKLVNFKILEKPLSANEIKKTLDRNIVFLKTMSAIRDGNKLLNRIIEKT